MRIYLKDSSTPLQNVGFVALRSLLQKQSPLLGLSVEVDDQGHVTATHYLYALNEEGMTIKRYPLRRVAKLVSVVEPYTRSAAITDPFISFNETAVPTVPNDADTTFFSEEEKVAVLSPIRDCFSAFVNAFPNSDPQVLRSIFGTLFSAGFVTHTAWQDNLVLLIKHQDKMEDINHALSKLHATGILTQKIFTAVVEHPQASKCAVALLQLFDKYADMRQIPYKKARQLDDEIIFPTLRPDIIKLYKDFVTTVVAHPFPLEVSKIIVFLHHSFGQQQKFNSDILVAITKMTDGPTLHRVGPILYNMPKKLITNENCLALLKSSHSKLQNITNTMRYLLKPSKAALTQPLFDQPLFDCLIAYDDPQVLMATLSKYSKRADPSKLAEVLMHLAKAGIGTQQNLDAYRAHVDMPSLTRLLNEVILTGAIITQPIFDTLCAYPNPTNQSAVEILASTVVGRYFLRTVFKTEEGKCFFGNAEISPETLEMQVDGKSIREWVSMTTDEEFEEKAAVRIKGMEEQFNAFVAETTARRDQSIELIHKSGLFSLRKARNVAVTGERTHSDSVTPILQQLVYGDQNAVKTALEAAKTNPKELETLLCSISTVTDYSGKQVTDTLVKAAFRGGDVAIHKDHVEMTDMLKPYFDLIPNGHEEFELQLLEVFPEGVDEKYQAMEADSKRDFEPMLQAAKDAILAEKSPDPSNRNDPTNNLNATLNKQKDNVLYKTLDNVFRNPFEDLSNREKTFNPYHLLRAYEVYNDLWDQCERDKSDLYYKKRDLFWRQIIGYTQRFVPACYAQAFVQGLWDLVWVDGYQSSNWQAKALERSIKLKYEPGSYFTSSSPDGVPLVLGFDFAAAATGGGVSPAAPGRRPHAAPRVFSKTFVEQKQQAFRTYCATVASACPQASALRIVTSC